MQSSLCLPSLTRRTNVIQPRPGPGAGARADTALHKQLAGAPQCRRAKAQPAARRANKSVVSDKEETTRVTQHAQTDEGLT